VQGPQADDWKRLGAFLQGRRGQLSPQWRRRSRFAASDRVTRAMISGSVIRDIETGVRKTYKPAMLASLERVYEMPAGSILAYIESGDPAVLPPAPGAPLGADALTLAYQQIVDAGNDMLDAIEDRLVANPDPLRRATDVRRFRNVRRDIENARQDIENARRDIENARRAEPQGSDGNGGPAESA